jgi:prepilin-type N-terminal cleavage/methylation domain-containing protein
MISFGLFFCRPRSALKFEYSKGTQAGFTLLELMIAITLLAFLSALTTQSIRRAVQTKTKLQKSIETNARLRDALRVIERDIQMAYHHRDFTIDLYNRAGEENQRRNNQAQNNANNPNDPNNPNNPNTPGVPPNAPNAGTASTFQKKRPLPQLTFFFGEENKLTLTTRTNARTSMNQPVSEQLRVSYYLDSCKSRRDPTKSSKCLWRRVNPYFEESVELLDGETSALIEDVDSLKFRYIGDTTMQEWGTAWKSKNGEPNHADKFPMAVEVTLSITDPNIGKGKPISVQTVAMVRFPNNAERQGTPVGTQ